MKNTKKMKKVLNTFLCMCLVSVSSPMGAETIYAKGVEKLAVDSQRNSFTAKLLEKNFNNVKISLSPNIENSNIKVGVVRKGKVIKFNKASSKNIYSNMEYFLEDNHILTVSKLQNSDVIVISNNNIKKYFQYKDSGLLSSNASLNEIEESKVDIDKILPKEKTYSFSDLRLETSLVYSPKITGNGNFEKIGKIFVNEIELNSVNNNYELVDGKYHKTSNGIEIQKLDDRDKVVFKSSDNEILGAYRYIKSKNSFTPIDVATHKNSNPEPVNKHSESGDENTANPKHKDENQKTYGNNKINSISGNKEGSGFDKYYVIEVSPNNADLIKKINTIDINGKTFKSVSSKLATFGGGFYIDGSKIYFDVYSEPKEKEVITFKASNNSTIGSFEKTKNGYLNKNTSNNNETTETGKEKKPDPKHKDENQKTDGNNKINSISGNKEGSGFDEHYVIEFSPNNADLIKKINTIDINGTTYTSVSSKAAVFGNKFYIDGSKIYFDTSSEPKEKEVITFKASNNSIIGSFEKTKNGYLNKNTSNNNETTETGKEKKPDPKHKDENQKTDENNKINSISGNKEGEGFDEHYVIEVSPNNADLIKKINTIDINGTTYTSVGSKAAIFGNKFYIDGSKIYFDTHSEPKEKEVITFKASNNSIIGSFEKTKNGYVDINKKKIKENSEKKELKVKIKGKFEAAIMGQKKYDAISGATGTVTNVKNSNVNVYLQEVEPGQEPSENAWKLVKESGIHIVKGGEKTSRGVIKGSGSGMKVGYNPYESSLVLQGIPDKEGEYKISVIVVDENGRSAQSNELPFKIYNLNKVKLIDQLVENNFEKFPNGDEYKWDMEPWEIHTLGGTNETVTIPKNLKAWFGSHESGTYGYLGRSNEEKETSIKQTIIIPEDKEFSFVRMQLLTSVNVIVKRGAKLNINDSAIYGNIIVEDGGILQVNYNEREKKLTTGSSINGKIILKEGAILENSAIYSNTNAVTDGKKANKNTDPVVEVEGNAIIRGNVFIRGDESPTGNDSKGVPFAGQKALKVKNAKLTIEKDATLGLYGGGKFATTTNGGDALVLDKGVIDGQGTLIAVGGTGSGLSKTKKGGDAISGNGDILVDKAYLQGGYSSSNRDDTFGNPFTEKIKISNKTLGEAKKGKSISSLKNTTIPNEYWGDTIAPGNDKNHNPLDFTKVVGTETIAKKLNLNKYQIIKNPKQDDTNVKNPKQDDTNVKNPKQDDTNVKNPKQDDTNVKNPKQDDTNVKNPKQDDTNVKNPKQDDTNVKNPKQDDTNVKNPKQNGHSVKKPNNSASNAIPNKTFKRLSGKNRIETAVEVSRNNFKTAETVIIARSDIYPDALSASMLSKVKKSPILLTPSNKLEEIVKKEIQRLGAKNVIILGGDVSISKNVEGSLGKYNIERLSGKDRYETSANIARKLAKENNINSKAIIASGETWADALAAGSFAGKENHPILLVKKNSIPESVKRVIKDLKIKDFYIVGGRSRIGENVRKQLPNIIKEFEGKDRYETSRKLAEYGFKSSENMYLTSGKNFADSIVIGGVAGMNEAPIILTNGKTLEKETKNYMDKTGIKNINIVGGTRMISDEFEKNHNN